MQLDHSRREIFRMWMQKLKDMKMKKRLVFLVFIYSFLLISCKTGKTNKPVDPPVSSKDEVVTSLTNDTFRQYVYDYQNEKTWNYKGSRPAIVDFYADWCPPCRELSPLVEEVAKEYAGKIVVYKVNTDQQKAVSQALGIKGLPTLLFIPMKGKPQVVMGYVPKENLVKGVNEVLLK
jgi:thioredoxin